MLLPLLLNSMSIEQSNYVVAAIAASRYTLRRDVAALTCSNRESSKNVIFLYFVIRHAILSFSLRDNQPFTQTISSVILVNKCQWSTNELKY